MAKPIISHNIRLRHPELFTVGEGSIVDDYCYFSTRVEVGRYCHVATGCSVAGGRDRTFRLGDFSSLSAGVRVWCTSDDFARDLVVILPPDAPQVKENLITGDVDIGRYTAVGSNSVVMPRNRIPEGTVIGALSFVPTDHSFEPWSVYAGIPVRKVGVRDRAAVLRQVAALEESIEKGGAP